MKRNLDQVSAESPPHFYLDSPDREVRASSTHIQVHLRPMLLHATNIKNALETPWTSLRRI
jgi:hypothetical protein